MPTEMTHRELCFDLAYAKGTQFIEVPLGPVWKYHVKMANGEDPGRADVVTIKPSYDKFNMDIYECKATRADFLGDIKSKKYERYFHYCHRLYFACLSGIANKREMPDGVGLIIKGEKGWSVIKAARKRDVSIPEPALLSLLFYRGRVFNSRRENLIDNSWRSGRDRYKGLAKHIRKALVEYDNVALQFGNLLWEVSEMNGCSSYDESCKWIDEWKSEHTYR